MAKQRQGYKKDGHFFVWCKDHYEEVNENVYRVIMQDVWKEEKRKQRMVKCRNANGSRCTGNCEMCSADPSGSPVSLERLQEESGYEPADSTNFQDAVELAITLDSLFDQLKGMVPDGKRIADMIINSELEKDVAKELGIPKTTLNSRKKKVLSFLQENLIDFIR